MHMQKSTQLLLLTVPFLFLPLSAVFAQHSVRAGFQSTALSEPLSGGDQDAVAFKPSGENPAYAPAAKERTGAETKIPFRDEDGTLKFEQYNRQTREFIISDSAGRVVGYLVCINPAKIFVLSSKRVFMGYILKKGRSYRKYDALGRLVKKEKARAQGYQNLYACLEAATF